MRTRGYVPFFDDGNGSNKSAYVVVGTGSYGTVTAVNAGLRIVNYGKFAIWLEDCNFKAVNDLAVGCSDWERTP